jgi:hypothetical protein
LKESEIKNIYRLINIFLGTLPLNPWAIFALWLHLEVPQIFLTNACFEKILMPSSYDIRIRQNWYCRKQKHRSFNENISFLQ